MFKLFKAKARRKAVRDQWAHLLEPPLDLIISESEFLERPLGGETGLDIGH
jgi:hypothetical protein